MLVPGSRSTKTLEKRIPGFSFGEIQIIPRLFHVSGDFFSIIQDRSCVSLGDVFFFFYKYFYYVFLLCLSVDWTTILASVMYFMSIFAALFSVVVIQIVLYV